MAKVAFKAKVQNVYNMDNTLAFQYVKVPTLNRSHCDMAAFRSHKKIGPYANSDLFPSILARSCKSLGLGGMIRLEAIPDGVEVDTTGFLASVSFNL